jgi:hypothetical protein
VRAVTWRSAPASWQNDGIAGTEHQPLAAGHDLGLPRKQVPDLLGVEDVRRALLAGPHLHPLRPGMTRSAATWDGTVSCDLG